MQKLVPFLIAFCGLCVNALAVEIIAHRGASYDAPENTVAAFKLGWEQQADAVELDIWLSQDGQIVALHDDNTKRTAGVEKKVWDQSLAELRALDAGSWKDAKWAGEKIPTLTEALAAMPAGKRVFIEIKDGSKLLPELVRVLKSSGRDYAQFVIIAFNYETASQAKQLLPGIPNYWLHSYKADKKTGQLPVLEALIAKTKAAKLDGLNLNYQFPIDRAFVQQVKSAGLGLYVWTVNDAEVARRLAEAGVDGITTDRPAWLREQLQR